MTYFIKTFGCQMNFSDSERLKTFFAQNGCAPAEDVSQADLVLINTCGVRQTAEDRVYSLVHNLRQHNRPAPFRKPVIIITGCLAHRNDVQRKLQDKADLFIRIKDITKLFILLKERYPMVNFHLPAHVQLQQLKQPCENDYLHLAPQYKYSDQAFVPIMTGCNNFCSYCVVPYARGSEWSRPMQDIVEEIDMLSRKGCQEVHLLGQNVNSYNYILEAKLTHYDGQSHPQEIDFPILLNFLAQAYPRMTFRFLTSHPKDFCSELIETIAENPNISRDIHLPIQSGSDRILAAMNRPYTQEHYLYLIDTARAVIPGVRFSTDVIVGFPGETEEDFQETMKVFQKVRYYEAFINKYSPRPGTAAYQLEDTIPWEEKKRREHTLRQLMQQYS